MALTHCYPPFTELTYHPSPRRVRGTRDGVTIVDSTHATLVWAPGKMVPAYAFPRTDVDLPSNGNAASADLRELGGPDLEGYVVAAWDAVEHWYEEEQEIFVHPRDPFVRVDAIRSSRHVRVERDGQLIAESEAPILVFETGLLTRYYLPPSDVNASLLQDSDLHTACPYKGIASYRDVVLAGHRHPNLFWYYPNPLREVAEIEGYLAPYSERVDLIVDGELQDRPPGPLAARARTQRSVR